MRPGRTRDARFRGALVIALSCAPLAAPSPLGAQDGGGSTAVLVEAQRAQEAGDYARAIRLLEEHLSRHPAELGALRLLAETVYWHGDFSAAARHFREVLRQNPQDGDARRQLGEILTATAPWVTLRSGGLRDDQPVRTIGGGAEFGWFLTPMTSLRLEAGSTWLGGTGSQLYASTAALQVAGYAPDARIEWKIDAGALRRDALAGSAIGATSWTGGLEVGARLPREVVLRARLEREPYLKTDASLDTTLHTDAVSLRAVWTARSGWAGEAAWGAHRFPDANVVSNAYVWLLAPLMKRDVVEMKGGYAFGWQDARESRFVMPDPTLVGAVTGGRYEPYYTPDRIRVHSAIGSLGIVGRSLALRGDGAFGFRASEWVPVQPSTSPSPSPSPGPGIPGAGGGTSADGTRMREFRPWRIRAVVSASPFTSLSAELSGEHTRTAYYAASTFALRFVWRALPRLNDLP